MALAMNIVKTWPQLSQKRFGHLPAHFLFFNTNNTNVEGRSKNGGYIESRVEHLMRKLPVEERRYVKRRKLEIAVVETPNLEPVQLVEANRATIEQSLRGTVDNRDRLRKSGASAAEMINYFPGLLRYSGDMIDIEFELLRQHGRQDIGDSPMMSWLPKIIANTNLDLQVCQDVSTKAILSLLAGLPKPRKKQPAMPINNIIDWLAEGLIKWIHVEDNIEDSMVDCKWEQPYIICVTETPSTFSEGAYSVVVDRKLMESGFSILRAVETLYKMYYVFNLKFPPRLNTFFGFFDLYVFRYNGSKPTSRMEKYFNLISQ